MSWQAMQRQQRGDFTTINRTILLSATAVIVGTVSVGASWVLLHLIRIHGRKHSPGRSKSSGYGFRRSRPGIPNMFRALFQI
jgi:hypothetical protein